MTPIHESRRLNRYAKAKAAEIRAKGLPHCAPDFDIVVHTEADYSVERSEFIALGLHRWRLAPVHIPVAAVQTYVASNPHLIATIDGKIARLPDMVANERTDLRTRLLGRKLTADNKLVEIRGHNPAAWEHVQELRAARAAALEIECLIHTGDPRDLLVSTAIAYKDTLRESIAFLTEGDALDVAWGTTADWLAECPLDFRARSVA